MTKQQPAGVSYYTIQQWQHQIANDLVADQRGIRMGEWDEEYYRAGALAGAQQMIATLKLQGLLSVHYGS